MTKHWLVLIFNLFVFALALIFMVWLSFTLYIEYNYNNNVPDLKKAIFSFGVSLFVLYITKNSVKRKFSVISSS